MNSVGSTEKLLFMGLLGALALVALPVVLFVLLPVAPLLVALWWRNQQPQPCRFPWKAVGWGYLGLLGFALVAVVINAISPDAANLFVFFSVILGFIVFLIVASRSGSTTRNVKRGSRIIAPQSLQSYLNAKQRQFLKESGKPEPLPRLSIAGIQLPTDLENLGIFTIGSPGSGKTQAIAQLLSDLRQRRDFRVVCFDRNAEFLEKFYHSDDLIFNPSDARSVSWSHYQETARPETVAAALIPEGTGDNAFFNDAARSLLADLYERCDSNAEIWEVLANLSLEDLTDFVKGGLSHRYFVSEKTGGSVLSTLINYARFYRELPDAGKPFSFVDWAQSDDPRSLWLPLFEEDAELFKPLYSAAFELVLKGLLTNESRGIKTAIIIDELGALNRLRSLSRLLSESRKFKGLPILGTQTEAQIRKTYGDEDARIILQGTRTKLILNCGDPESAELGANLIGRQERIERSTTHSSGSLFGSVSMSESIRETYAVLPAELQGLPKLEGYLTISDGTPAAKVKITPRSYDAIAPRLERRSRVSRI